MKLKMNRDEIVTQASHATYLGWYIDVFLSLFITCTFHFCLHYILRLLSINSYHHMFTIYIFIAPFNKYTIIIIFQDKLSVDMYVISSQWDSLNELLHNHDIIHSELGYHISIVGRFEKYNIKTRYSVHAHTLIIPPYMCSCVAASLNSLLVC